ncbi:MAG: tetratricopeptide repeat protein [Fuerstiella sp.]
MSPQSPSQQNSTSGHQAKDQPPRVAVGERFAASALTSPAAIEAAGFVGSAACAECHQQIADSYRLHPMANSVRHVDDLKPGDVAADGRVDGLARFYEVDRDPARRLIHCEKMLDVDGELIFEQPVAMDYVVGSGRRAFAFLQQQGALLFQSPLNWYSATREWALSPGYQQDDPRRFRRRITDDCLACHVGKVVSTGRAVNRYAAAPFHEMSIGCENCHGPGQDHISAHRRNESLSQDPIVNPGRLDHRARDSVCYQCHLQATARVLRPGRSHFDFRPGMNMEEIWVVLDAGVDVSADGQSRAVNHVQQMQASRCYVASEGQLSCITCHDPHRVPDAGERDLYYRQRCLSCHEEQHCRETSERRAELADSCIACHMPGSPSTNISHVSQTDHRVLRRPSGSPPPLSDESDQIRLQFFDRMDTRIPDWEARRAMAAAVWLALDKKGQPAPASLGGLLAPALEQNPRDHVALTLSGALARQHNRLQEARRYFEQARSVPAAEESAVSGLLTIHYLNFDWNEALNCADRMIELDPGESRFHGLRADILKSLGRLDEGIAEAQRALELDPTQLPFRQWLVDALGNAGRTDERDVQQRLLDRMTERIQAARRASKPEFQGGSEDE